MVLMGVVLMIMMDMVMQMDCGIDDESGRFVRGADTREADGSGGFGSNDGRGVDEAEHELDSDDVEDGRGVDADEDGRGAAGRT